MIVKKGLFFWSVLLLVLFFVSSTTMAEEKDPFAWNPVPDTALVYPERPIISDCYSIIKSSSTSLLLLYHFSSSKRTLPEHTEKFCCLIATPAGQLEPDGPEFQNSKSNHSDGIASLSIEHSPPQLLKRGRPVQAELLPADLPDLPAPQTSKSLLGVYRGAQLNLLEFRPRFSVAGIKGVDSAWVNSATILVRFAHPLHAPLPVHPGLMTAAKAVLINPEDFPRCLSSPAPYPRETIARASLWRAETLQIRTATAGWHSLSARRVLSEWGKVSVEELSLSRRGVFLREHSQKQADYPTFDRSQQQCS